MHADLEKKDYVEWVHFLRLAETWDRARIEEYQLQQLREIVRLAGERAPGYRARFAAAGVGPDTLRGLDDLRRFPLLDKETLRDQLEAFSVPMTDRTFVTTGGSTGIPLKLYRDPQAFPRELASKAYQYYRVGWKEGDRQLVFRGLPIATPDHVQFVPEFNELRCSSYHLTPETMDYFYRRALEYQPEWLRCYPSSGFLFARFLKERNGSLPSLRGVLCASENLYDHQRQLMKEVFRARVFSHYGHYELAVLAGFCEHEDTYHVLPAYGYAELLDVNGRPVTEPGRMGEIVGTSFIMRATPMIRYRTRDYAVLRGWGCPSCGRPYQVWERIEGRLQEFLVTGTGRLISMTAINFHDDIFDPFLQFQFYQEERGRATLRYIPRAGVTPDLAAIGRRLRVKLGDDMELAFQAVDDIPPTARGKHRFLIQKMDVAYHDG